MVEHLLQTLPPDCAEELKLVLETPPEQQTQDQLSEECRALVQQGASSFQQQRRRAAAGDGDGEDGAEDDGAEQQARMQPRRYERVKLPPKGSGGGSKKKASRRSVAAAYVPPINWSEYAETAKLLVMVVFPVFAVVLWRFIRHMEKEAALTPAQRAERDEARAREDAALKKRLEKARRQGKNVDEVD